MRPLMSLSSTQSTHPPKTAPCSLNPRHQPALTLGSIQASRVAATRRIVRVRASRTKVARFDVPVPEPRLGAFGRPYVATALARRPRAAIEVCMRRFALFLLAVAELGCGADAQTGDASVTDSATGDGSLADGSGFDSARTPDPILVDGGNECGLPQIDTCHDDTLWTCCNGSLCGGACVLFPDASTPGCYCFSAHLRGGCPTNTVCCEGSSQGCIAARSCGTSHQPPPGGCPSDGG